ncbi:MAG: tyrosine-protein phosphatase, partial [Clostridia bacterium]|nr:tyrosine-protein phosphatase [Clostridia bacterium]
LRDPNYVGPDAIGPLGKNIPRKFYDMVYYNQIFTEEGKEKVYDVFYDLALKKNYPVYLHCTYGVDRTGTICFLLEALLGVPEETLLFDYSLSYLYFLHVTSDNLKPFLEEFKSTVEGDTLKEKAENYLLSVGITPLQIDSIREIFLEDIPKE